jgi:hypothetical protein
VTFKNKYKLTDSQTFEMHKGEEITVNLNLAKEQPCCDTLFAGCVCCLSDAVPNAGVFIYTLSGKLIKCLQTNVCGCFCIENQLEPGKYFAVAAAQCCKVSKPRVFTICEGRDVFLAFQLLPQIGATYGIVYGSVADIATGFPIQGAYVYLNRKDSKPCLSYKVAANACGEYIVYNVAPGEYDMRVCKHGYEDIPIKQYVDRCSMNVQNFMLCKCLADC